jgi:hypothetical protein
MPSQCFNAHYGEREDPDTTHPSSALTTSNTTSFYLEFNACTYLCPIQQTNWFCKVRLAHRILCIIIDYFPHHHFTKALTCSGLPAGEGGGGREVAGEFFGGGKTNILHDKNDFKRKAN